ncbi:MAG TPA: hypothetical protein H9827_00640 [Candidatus Luteimonas excrementigallinarum]|nr:hypothetical protein [Candidatus Luteimonas excrementigallinarum]
MKEKDKARWAAIREKGALRFILIYGVLGWGVGTAVVFTGLMWLMGDADVGRIFRFAALAFPIGGLAWGAIMWWVTERMYRRG